MLACTIPASQVLTALKHWLSIISYRNAGPRDEKQGHPAGMLWIANSAKGQVDAPMSVWNFQIGCQPIHLVLTLYAMALLIQILIMCNDHIGSPSGRKSRPKLVANLMVVDAESGWFIFEGGGRRSRDVCGSIGSASEPVTSRFCTACCRSGVLLQRGVSSGSQHPTCSGDLAGVLFSLELSSASSTRGFLVYKVFVVRSSRSCGLSRDSTRKVVRIQAHSQLDPKASWIGRLFT